MSDELLRASPATGDPSPSVEPARDVDDHAAFPHAAVIAAVVTGAILTGLLLNTSPALCPNDMSRWNAIWAMVETGRCSWIGDRPFWTIDRCTYDTIETPEDGKKARWYSSKPYFMQVILAGLAWPICRIGGLEFAQDLRIVGRLIILVAQIVPLTLFIAFFGRWLRGLGARGFTFAYCVTAAAGGTYVTAWCITLNNHVPAALCAFFSLYALYVLSRRADARWHTYATAGFFAGMAAAFETPATAMLGLGAAYVAYVAYRRGAIGALAFVPAGVLPVIAFFVSNYVCTGRWIPFQWTFPQHYDPYWFHPTGMDALAEPKPRYLFHLTLGHHGFFSLTPVLLFGLIGIVRHLLDRRSPLRAMAGIVGLASAAVFSFNTMMTNNYGGTCQGARWLFWLVPLWLVMVPAGVEPVARSRLGRSVALLLLAVSAFSAAYAVHMPWSQSWLHSLIPETAATVVSPS